MASIDNKRCLTGIGNYNAVDGVFSGAITLLIIRFFILALALSMRLSALLFFGISPSYQKTASPGVSRATAIIQYTPFPLKNLQAHLESRMVGSAM